MVAADVHEYPRVALTVAAPPELAGIDVSSGFEVRQDGTSRALDAEAIPGDTLEVALVIDTSGSMLGRAMEAAQLAAVDFVERLPEAVRMTVVGFGDRPRVASTMGSGRADTVRAIRGLTAQGETALYDGVLQGLGQLSRGSAVRRAMVLLSDGADTASAASLSDTRRALRKTGVDFHAIHLETTEGDSRALTSLSRAAGGNVLSADDPDTLQSVYDGVAAALANQYLVTFTSRGHGATDVDLSLRYGTVAANTTHRLRLPPAAAPAPALTTLDPTVRIVGVNDDDYPEMEVTVVAPRPLAPKDLRHQAFEVLEGGRAADVDVERLRGLDLEVVLAIDISGSMQGQPIEEAKQAALKYLEQMPAGTRVAVIGFAENPKVLSEFTGDLAGLRTAITALEASGETALFDATILAAKMFKGREPAARSIVLLSDGGDTVSSQTLAAAEAAVDDVAATVHSLELATEETDRVSLQRLASTAGGEVTPVEDAAALTEVFDGLATDVGNQYVLRYRSSLHGETDLEVGVDAGGVAARASRAVVLPPLPWFDAFLASPWGLRTGAAAVYVSLTLLVLLLLAPKPVRARLAGMAGFGSAGPSKPTGLAEVGTWAKSAIERALQNRGWIEGLNTRLERAGVLLRPGEFVLLAAGAASVLLIVGTVARGTLTGLLLAAVVPLVAKVVLSALASRRRVAFGKQLGDTMQMMAGSLRSGYGLLQAADAVAREADSPTAEEFRRLVMETRLGRDIDDTLRAMGERVGSEDFKWVMQAIQIHRQIGGDLAQVLDEVASTIREREQVFRQVKALSAEGRLSAIILLALPFVVVGGISVTNPSYMDELFTTRVGHYLIATGFVLMAVGAVWVRKIVEPKF
ncbi:MAG: VWA domain-containing protein [Euzebyales bacterium]|nr:VWA domain-containing protein [Euzebyales bacterium]